MSMLLSRNADRGYIFIMLTQNDIQLKKGSRIIFEALKNLGVDTVFGYPGGIVLNLYNELVGQNDIRHILTRHEQSAVHSAEGYARETGKCGVVWVTSGPGATNTVSGITNAYMDGYPLVVITGQVYRHLLGKNAFQEANICDMVKSCTKKVFQIKSASQIYEVLTEAFRIANSGKKGPVLVDVVKDVFEQEISDGITEVIVSDKEEGSSFSKINVSKVLSRLGGSKCPVILAGGGVKHSKSENELYEFAQKYSIPVVSTMMGLGTYPADDELYLGMVGIFGDNSANKIIKESDLILSLGARLNDRITCMFKDVNLVEKFIQVDINSDEISNFIKTKDYYNVDIKDFLNALNQAGGCPCEFTDWAEKVQSFKNDNIKRTRKTNRLHSFEVIRKIEEFTKGEPVTFTTEVGQHQLWAVQNLNLYKERKIFVSGGSGTMGFGFPAAIGASIANPEKKVVCIAGDGSFQMSLHELATCKDNDLNVKIMILNNGYLGMVRQLQEKLCNGRYSETKISNPDFVTLAKSYDIPAQRVTCLEDVDCALAKAFGTKGTYLIDFAVEPMEVL